jgi:hypothetical protein
MGPICGYCKKSKKTNGYYGELYVGIATNGKCQRLFVPYMRVLQGMQNASGYYGTHMRVLQGM